MDPRSSKVAEEQTSLSAEIVYKAILIEGRSELERSSAGLGFSGLAAGLSMGFSLVAEGLLKAHLPDATWTPLVSKLGYSVGFLIVTLGRQQLFTETTVTAVLPFLARKSWGTLLKVLRFWAVILVANLIGTLAFAYFMARTQVFDPNVKMAFAEIGQNAMQSGFVAALLKGIVAGWLIALIVWLLPFAQNSKVLVIIILTYIVGVGELTHIIAGSVEAIYTVAVGKHSWGEYLLGYLLPTLLGNTIGGVSLVALINHAQVTAGEDQTL